MTLPSSGLIQISQIITEYNGGVNGALSSYYRGGGLVRNISSNASIPTSGTIRLSDFYGCSNTLTTAHSWNVQFSPSTTSWGYSDGTFEGGAFGSLSPTTGNGLTIKLLCALQGGPNDFRLELAIAGFHPQNVFQSWQFFDHNFTNRTKTWDQAESYSQLSGSTYWRWQVGIANPISVGDTRTFNITW